MTTETVTPTGVDGGGAYTAADANETCAIQRKTTKFYSLLGDISKPVWVYTSSTLWCWDGTQITYIEWERPISTLWPWTFAGHIDTNESGGLWQWSHYDYTHGHFKQCFGGKIGCVNDMYPSHSKYQYGNGSSS